MIDSQLDCNWPGNDALMRHYHDHEWGIPLHDDQKLFEFMVLDAFQAGLSWKTILDFISINIIYRCYSA
jgi:DNA-3-methyladenine glycosylase I